MTRFNGNNSLKTSRLAFERAKYKLEAFQEDHPHVSDFNFAERTFYGRVNRMLEPVVANEEFLTPIATSDTDISTHRAMNFVSQQFKDMELHFSKACRMGVIPIDDPILSSLKIKRSYESPIDAFKLKSSQTMRSILDNFVLQNKELVNSFDDFIKLFMDFYLNSDNSETLTLSDYMKSKNSNYLQSGLAIDIGGLSFADDAAKEQQMFNSPAFKYYINIAKQYGFHISLNNPGLLISDLASPVTTEYRKRFRLFSVQSVFNNQYLKTTTRDLDLLEQLLLNAYNNYVSINPYNKKYISCNDNTVQKVINIKNVYNINYNSIILIYINMKNFFEGTPLSRPQLEQVKRTTISIANYDKERAVNYVEDQFKAHYNQKDGSLTYFNKRIKNI